MSTPGATPSDGNSSDVTPSDGNSSDVTPSGPGLVDGGWSVPGFRATRLLGFGASGEVWLGIEEATGERVALKRLRTDRPDGDREQLRREAALLAAFRHPGVVGLRAVRAVDADLVLVLDLAEGGSLAQVLGRVDRLRSGEMVGFVAPVADALAAAHREGLLHGDVSPGNLLLTADGRPLLADLGTARLAGDERAPVRATSRYLDPAVRAGGPLTAASDVYALAAVAAHALTARPVSASSGSLQQWADHAYTLGVPAQLAAALCAGLVAAPARRPDIEEFAASLRDSCEAATLERLLPPASGVRARARTAPEAVERRANAASRDDRAERADWGDSVDGDGDGSEWDDTDPYRTSEPEDGGVDPDSLTHLVTGAVPAVPGSDAPPGRRWWRRRDQPEDDDRLTGWPGAVVRAAPGTARDGAERAAARPAPQRWPATGGTDLRRPRELVTRVAVMLVVVLGAAAGGVWWAAVDRVPGPPGGGPVPVADAGPSRPSRPSEPSGRSGPSARPVPSAPASIAPSPALSGPSPPPGPVRSVGPDRSSAGRWLATLDALDAARADAFARAEPALLARVYTPGSAALRADTTAVRALTAAGATAIGVRHELRAVSVTGLDANRVRLAVTDRMAGYRIVDGRGVVLRSVPARPETAFRVELRRTDGGWRIATVTR